MFILASKSPRRQELLSRLGLTFDIITADIDETMDKSLPIADAVCKVCEKKAAAVGKNHPGRLILAADTVVVADGTVLGKPHSKQQAHEMLRMLSDREHQVITGCCLWRDGTPETFCETTSIRFKPLSDAEIDAYIATGSPMDKAGAYGIQDHAAVFATGIIGDYYNVMGLPVCRVAQALRRHGIPVLNTTEP